MALRTISNAGGNYNATASWVQGIVPTSADDIDATATSGNLTVNVSSAARNCNLTNYTATLAMNNTWTLSGNGFTNTFVSAMTITGTGFITITNTNTIVTNGKIIPNLNLTGGTQTLGDNLNVVNLSNSTVTVNGNGFAINITGNTSASFFQISNGATGTLTINYTGTNQNLRNNFLVQNASPQMTINYAGVQYNPNGAGTGLQLSQGSVANRVQVNYISGSFSSGFNFIISCDDSGVAFNFGSASSAGINSFIMRGTISGRIELLSDFPVTNLVCSDVTLANSIYTIVGTGRFLATNTTIASQSLNAGGAILNTTFTLNLTPGVTHSFGNLAMLGSVGNNAVIKSTITAGAKAVFSVSDVQSVFRGAFTDCEVIGSPLHVLNSTLLRTTNITLLSQYFYSAGSGGETSHTFVN